MDENEPVQKLFEGVVPERIEEVMGLVEKYSAQFRLIGDRDGFNLDSGAYGAVQYTHRSMLQIWLFGYGGMLSLHSYSSFISILQSLDKAFDLNELKNISGQQQANEDFSQIMRKIKDLNNAASIEDFLWPENIPSPDEGRPIDTEAAAVFDLTCMATAYVFLHELKHVIFSVDRTAPENPIDEEYECDKFANSIMMSLIPKYAEESGYPEEKVAMKRAMGIALASAFLLLVTAKDSLGGSDTHPPIHGRWLRTVEAVALPENDYFFLYFSSIAVAMLQYLNITVLPRKFVSFKELSYGLIQDLENGI